MEEHRLFGIIGYPLAHSFSKRFFTDKFEREGLNAIYSNYEIEKVSMLSDILNENENLVGLNVTIPHKQKVMALLNDISDEAKTIGAVNVIKILKNDDGSAYLKGYNSDVYGFVKSIQPLIDSSIHKKALILGTGGASKAVAFGLKQLGVDSLFVSRTENDNDNIITYNDLAKDIIDECTVIVNCTPLGTFPDVDEAADIPYEYLSSNHLLYDLVYNPEETLFLKKGKEFGATIKNGAEMLELQAKKAWEIWNE